MKTESIHQSLKLLGFIYFYFLGTKTKLQELTPADSGTCQVPSGSFLTKLSLEGPWSISGRRRSCPPPCSVSSCSPPHCTAALPLLHHHHHSLCLHQDALSSSPWQWGRAVGGTGARSAGRYEQGGRDFPTPRWKEPPQRSRLSPRFPRRWGFSLTHPSAFNTGMAR